MYRIRTNHCALIVLAGILFISITASAMDIKPNASLAMQYTDNARKVGDKEKKDLIMLANIGASIDAANGPFQLNANTSLKYTDYTQDSFDNQQYFNLNATAGWEMLKDQLDWQLKDLYTQQSVNSLNPDTPDNTQNTNVLTFGPNFHYKISGRQSIEINPQYRKFTYEIQNTDNQQNSLDARWNYQLFRTLNVGLRGGTNKVDYKDQAYPDNTFTNIHFTLSAIRSDYNYSADIGSTRADRDGSSSTQGITGNIKWSYDITGRSNMLFYLASELTDASTSMLHALTNPDYASFSDEQISSEILRNNILKFTLQKNDATLTSKIWFELRQQDYEFALLDQETQTIGFDMRYSVTAVLSTGINVDYNRTELTDTPRKDNKYNIGGNINYRLSNKLLAIANLKFHDTNSSIDTRDFNELTIFFSLAYGYGG